jgi:hypothetical protein
MGTCQSVVFGGLLCVTVLTCTPPATLHTNSQAFRNLAQYALLPRQRLECPCHKLKQFFVLRQGSRARWLQVIDSGPGIPDEYKQHIFSGFTQATEACTREHGGAGLGLAVSHRLAQLMDSSLTISSEEGAGATATLSMQLPIAHRHCPASLGLSASAAATTSASADVPTECLQACSAVLHVHNAALRRQLHSECKELGMPSIDAPSSVYSECARLCESKLQPLLICDASVVTGALQQGWKRRGVIALCADVPVQHALRVFATSLMLPIKHKQFLIALVSAASGQDISRTSMQLSLGPLLVDTSATSPCSAGFGCKPCGYCAKCQAASDEGLAMLVRRNLCAW